MYKVQIDLAAETPELLIQALETAAGLIRSGHTSEADLLAGGWAEYDFLVQTSEQQPPQPGQRNIDS